MSTHLRSLLSILLTVAALLVGCTSQTTPTAIKPAAPSSTTAALPATTTASPKPSAVPAAPAPRGEVKIRVIASSTTAGVWRWLSAWAVLAQKYSWLRVDVLPSTGYVESLHLVLQGGGEVGVTMPYLINRARQGVQEFKDLVPRPDVRVITTTSEVLQHFIVLQGSPIKDITFDSLKGKTIVTREANTYQAYCTVSTLQALGLDPTRDVKLRYGTQDACTNALFGGTADIWLAVAGLPNAGFEELFATKPCRLIPVPPDLIKKINEVTGAGFSPATLPAGLYKGQTEPVPTGTSLAVIVSLEGVSEDVIYEFTRLWWDYMAERNAVSAEIANQATTANLQAFAASAGMEFHKGALKYYREKGWIK